MSIWASASEIKNDIKNNGVKNDSKVRLHKKEETTPNKLSLKIYNCYAQHYKIVNIFAIFLFLILFCEICFLIVGVSAVESGNLRNFINGGYL